jgi:hypothetical protein
MRPTSLPLASLTMIVDFSSFPGRTIESRSVPQASRIS